MNRPRLVAPALAALLTLACAGCGYTRGLRLPEGHESVGVAFFGNATYETDIERELHVALSRSVRELVGAPLVDPGSADAVVVGEVLDFRRRGGIRDGQNTLIESGVTIVLEGSLVERRGGETLSGPLRVGTTIGFVIQEGEGERSARARAIDFLAERLVLGLFAEARADEPDEPSEPDEAAP